MNGILLIIYYLNNFWSVFLNDLGIFAYLEFIVIVNFLFLNSLYCFWFDAYPPSISAKKNYIIIINLDKILQSWKIFLVCLNQFNIIPYYTNKK